MTRQRDALAAERRRLPMVRVEKDYVFEGPDGEAGLLDLFDGRRQLIVYRFFFEPGVARWPESGCGGCSMFVDNIGHFALPHLHARDTSLVLVSPAPQGDIERLEQRMGWNIPWFTTGRAVAQRVASKVAVVVSGAGREDGCRASHAVGTIPGFT